MRKAMDRQGRLDCPPVGSGELNRQCRDEIIPILLALSHVYNQPEVRDAILRLVAADVNRRSSGKRGRRGMDYWSILVLAAVRLGCNLNYDKLQDLAEQHRALRQAMHIGDWDCRESFDWRRIRDNLTLLRPQTVESISHLIVGEGHRLAPQAAETVRVDSFVIATNIHYPTESSLIRDGLRKVLEGSAQLADLLGVDGWRQHKHLYRKAKRLVRQIERISARKGPGYRTRLQGPYTQLLELAATVMERAEELRQLLPDGGGNDLQVLGCDMQLKTFLGRTAQVCLTARRRVLQGEKVLNRDKLFSIFETHTQLYMRGKAGEPMQFGRLALIFEDGLGFIPHAYRMPREANDRDVAVEQTRAVQNRLGGRIKRASYDRGFHSPENQRKLAEILAHPCLPKPGTRQAAEQEQQASVEFRQSRQRHPGIESAINALRTGNGLERCRDRSEEGFSRYLQLAVLGRNLHVLGKLLLAREDAQCQAAQSRRKKLAA